MPKYLFTASYTAEGLPGLLQEGGSGRRAATQAAVESAGGTLESFYYAFGDTDVFIIADLPDDESAAALNLAAAAAGAVSTKTTVLLTAEQLDAASKKAVTYRKPGG